MGHSSSSFSKDWTCPDNNTLLCPPCGTGYLHNLTLPESYPFWLGTSSCHSPEQVLHIFNYHDQSALESAEQDLALYYQGTYLTMQELYVWQSKYGKSNDTNQRPQQHVDKAKDEITKIYADLQKNQHSMEQARHARNKIINRNLLGKGDTCDVKLLETLTTTAQRNLLRSLNVRFLTSVM